MSAIPPIVASAPSLWRSAANDSMEGSGDFPEPILMLIEAINGPREGEFTSMEFHYTIQSNGKTKLCITDNGSGMQFGSDDRFLSWSSPTASVGTSVYGHGLKKMLAKHGPYTMPWSIHSRVADFNGVFCYSGPWNGTATPREILPERRFPDMPTTGFRINLECDTCILFPFNEKENVNGRALFDRVKELICTRKSQAFLNAVNFAVRVEDQRCETERVAAGSPSLVEESSHTAGWRSLEAVLEDLEAPVESDAYKGVTKIIERVFPLVDGKSEVLKRVYCLGRNVIPGFPIFTTRQGDKLLRNHIYIGNSMIEAPDPRVIVGCGRLMHPHFLIIDQCRAIDPTNPDHLAALPRPATTKVSLRRECPNTQRVFNIIKDTHKEIISAMKPMRVDYLTARIRDAAVGVPAAAQQAAAVGGAGVEPLPPAAPVWTPIAITDITMESLRHLTKDDLERNCAFYGIPKADKKAENINLLFALTLSAEQILNPLQELDLDDEENRLLRCLLHAAIMKARRI